MAGEERSAIDGPTFEALIRQQVPFIGVHGVRANALGRGWITLILPFSETFLRPGGSIAGPVLFALADVALYGAVMTRIGRTDMAVTSSMTINFLRRPAPCDVVAEGRILKIGRRLAYGEVTLSSRAGKVAAGRAVKAGDDAGGDADAGGQDEVVAHATGSYALPTS